MQKGTLAFASMQASIDTRQPRLVEAEIQAAYRDMFPQGDLNYIPKIFGWALECFSGNYLDYQPIDAHYHDLEHTLQGALCMARLLHHRHMQQAEPRLTQRMFELGMLAILMHDTGYLKRRNDNEGTGAKYTLTHVERSMEFAADLMRRHSFTPEEIISVQNMIRCTGVNVKLDSIKFQSEIERITGFALGTADLLGQMAATDYVEKLPVLYTEFAEAAAFNGDKMKAGGFFSSARDLMQKTPQFWSNYVQQKINRDFMAIYRFLNDPYPDGGNPYIEQIEANMLRLHRKLAEAAQG
jgi:hypothetical protein